MEMAAGVDILSIMNQADAIIVFGGGIFPDGALTPDSKARVELAVKKWQEKSAPLILLCGRWSFNLDQPPVRTEAAAMAEYAEQLGCSRECLLLEEKSTDTLGNAYFAKTLFAMPRKWTRLLVIVADYHAPRSRFICQKVFGQKYKIDIVEATLEMAPAERAQKDRRERASLSFLAEWSKDIDDGNDQKIWQIMDTKHPGYAAHPEFTRDKLKQMIAKRAEQG